MVTALISAVTYTNVICKILAGLGINIPRKGVPPVLAVWACVAAARAGVRFERESVFHDKIKRGLSC
jgi:hypothetical protein